MWQATFYGQCTNSSFSLCFWGSQTNIKSAEKLTSFLACWEPGWWTPTTELYEMQIYSGSFSGNLKILLTLFRNALSKWKGEYLVEVSRPQLDSPAALHAHLSLPLRHQKVQTSLPGCNLIFYMLQFCICITPIAQSELIKSNNIDHTMS